MNALETYPPFNHKEAAELSASSEYAHVKSYSRGRMCGTLSKYEWEASCKFNGCDLNQYVIAHLNYMTLPFVVVSFSSISALYLVFAFQKMKKQYNDKGEVEYV